MLINLMRCGSGALSYRHDDKFQSFLYSFLAFGTDKLDIPGRGNFWIVFGRFVVVKPGLFLFAKCSTFS